MVYEILQPTIILVVYCFSGSVEIYNSSSGQVVGSKISPKNTLNTHLYTLDGSYIPYIP